jgi:hypothetical protein
MGTGEDRGGQRRVGWGQERTEEDRDVVGAQERTEGDRRRGENVTTEDASRQK